MRRSFSFSSPGSCSTGFQGNAFPSYFQTDRRLFSIGTADVRVLQVLIIVTAVITMFVLDRVVSKTKLGRSIRGVAEDAPTAALMGIDIDKTISRTFVIGGALAGVAGFLFATAFGFGNTMGFDQGVKAFAAAVLGGIGNIRGAMLGGLLLGLCEAVVPPLPRHRHRMDGRGRVRRARLGADLPADRPPRRAAGAGGMKRGEFTSPAAIKRLIACLAGSFVLALMWGPQEGTQEDYGYAFRQAIFSPRILVFLGIGVLVFLAITFWPLVRPYLSPARRSVLLGRSRDGGGRVHAAAVVRPAWTQVRRGQQAVGNTRGHIADSLGVLRLAALDRADRHSSCRWRRHRAPRPAAGLDRGGALRGRRRHRVCRPPASRLDRRWLDHSLGAFVALFGYLFMAVACGPRRLTQQVAAHARLASTAS